LPLTELKVLPTQPDTYAIPEEDEDEDTAEPEDRHNGEGVEVRHRAYGTMLN
jgi:hypothetical protein